MEILAEMGWEDEFWQLDNESYREVRTIFQSICSKHWQVPWDEAAWKRVELKAVRVLEQFRAQRLRIDRIEQYQNRLATMKVAVLSFRRDFGPAIFPLFPRYHEFAALPEIEQIITSPLPITPDTFSCLSDMIPGYLENWKQMTSDSLEALLRDSVDSDLPGDVRAIDLAIGQFLLCGVCNLILETTLRAPHHNCVGPGDHLAGRTDYEAAAIQATRSRLEIDFIPGTDILRELVEQCGQDYRRTTAEEMDNLDILLCCRSCECMVVWRDGREIMNWRAAAHHALSAKARDQYDCVWDVMKAGHPRFAIAKNLYSAALEGDKSETPDEWICGYCTERYSPPHRSLLNAQEHLRTVHQVANPVKHRDFFFDFDRVSLPRRTFFVHHEPKLREELFEPDGVTLVQDAVYHSHAAVVDLSDMIERS
ncbi:hypothetical protein NLI96_g2123 [Meripilus lineatus]|uniref:Uncharacterized protein n=1 Tax=Meripilus lineatus TaxID=2056292 RepID=A0AAD5YM71_9APHY|nr:hypothetical protein NLI96_g2123 [Physisporinus lineatus]